ncbi:MAG: 50S ribosomal protein L32 [Candidatus Omnitrophica bacterium]|nr:50S ribosomal protein L32 [Candidatus Omnitrophota bacterium]
MALPKRRHSSTRGKKRRTHWKLAAPNLTPCPRCKQPKSPHRVCPACGHYGTKQVIEVKVKKKKKKNK